ncbi:polysaccharide biosynthesis tyrosine autokinase [Paraburkholderia dinghuensis]|nr:polysaccharide biosynthesis tyrosine autokinase [Paraburkholderia dinghuensis]
MNSPIPRLVHNAPADALGVDVVTELSSDGMHTETPLTVWLSRIADSWRLILAMTLFVTLLGGFYAFVATPVYEVESLIQILDNDMSSKDKDSLGQLAAIFDKGGTAAGEIELIRSDLVVGQAVQQLHLDIEATPRYFPLIGAALARRVPPGQLAPPRFGLAQYAWGGEQISVSSLTLPEKLAKKGVLLIAQPDGTYNLVTKDGEPILLGRVGEPETAAFGDGTVAIQVDQLVARPQTQFVLKKYSMLYATGDLESHLTVAEKAKQSGMIGVTLRGDDAAHTAEILNTITSQYVKQNVDSKSSEAEHTLAFLEQQLPQLRAELDNAEEKYNHFRNENGSVDLNEESRLLLEQVAADKAKLVDLKQQRDEMIQRFTPKHPVVAALDAQIGTLQSELGELTGRVARMPDTEQNALRLMRNVRVDTELYTNLLNNAQQLRIVKAGQVGNVRVVDHAMVPEYPIRPNRPLVLGFSAVLGMLLGIGIALCRKAAFGGVEHSKEIEFALGVPVYAVVPRSAAQLRLYEAMERGTREQHVLAAVAADDVAIEGIRNLRTAMQFGSLGASNNIIAITGPRNKIGKSFVSVNFAAVEALGGKRVVLVDGDMRRGDLHEYLNIRRRPGLSDAIAGASLDSVLIRDALPGLDVLPQGMVPPNPAELLMSERFRSLLEELSSRYDIVIVDTPPVLAVTDAVLISRHAGATLLIVRYGHDAMSGIAETVRRLRHGGIAVKGVVMTDVPRAPFGYSSKFPTYSSETVELH